MAEADDRVPALLLTGFLGSGKTTLLNRILAHPGAGKVAVVVNEYGEAPIDGRLVRASEEEIVTLSNGCICCTVRGDLSVAVGRLLARRTAWFRRLSFDRLIIEPSGLASPGPIVQTFLLDPTLASQVRLHAIVAVASAADIVAQLRDHAQAGSQLAYADLVVLTHGDRVAPDMRLQAQQAVAARNPTVPLREGAHAAVDVDEILALSTGDPSRWRFFPVEAPGHAIGSVTLLSDAPLDLHRLKVFLQFVANDRAHKVLRMKGILVCTGIAEPVVVHGIGEWLQIGPGTGALPDRSALVFIGPNLDRDRLQRGWDAARAG